MGSYSQLTIADYPIFSNKNSYFQELTNIIFLPEDFIKEKRRKSTRNKLVWGAHIKEKRAILLLEVTDKQ